MAVISLKFKIFFHVNKFNRSCTTQIGAFWIIVVCGWAKKLVERCTYLILIKIHQLVFIKIAIVIIFFIHVVGICFMKQYSRFLEYCHNIIYIHMHGYLSTFKKKICCTLQDCNLKNSLGNISHCIIWYFAFKTA